MIEIVNEMYNAIKEEGSMQILGTSVTIMIHFHNISYSRNLLLNAL